MHPFPTPLPWCLCSNFCNSFNLKGIPSISSFYSPPYFAHNPGSKDSCSFCMPLLMPPLCSLPCRWYPSYQTDCHGQTLHLLLGAHAICPDQAALPSISPILNSSLIPSIATSSCLSHSHSEKNLVWTRLTLTITR